jgi:gamma-glutamyltranspeptidase/glutathione hydrolase
MSFTKGKQQNTSCLLKRKGAIITTEDLKLNMRQNEKSISFKYKDLNIISMAPPSSGGIFYANIQND